MSWLEGRLRGARYRAAIRRGLKLANCTPVMAIGPLVAEVANIVHNRHYLICIDTTSGAGGDVQVLF